MKRKVLSFLLALSMVISVLPATAFAEEPSPAQQTETPQGGTEAPSPAQQAETPQGGTEAPSPAQQAEAPQGGTENPTEAPQGGNENPQEAPMLMSMLLGTSTVKELNIADGNIRITDTGYTAGSDGETAFTGNYVITGTSTVNMINIAKLPENSTITLKDLSIDDPSKPTLIIEDGAEKVQLNVDGDVSLTSIAPALIADAPLAISGTGNLTLSSESPVISCGTKCISLDVEIDGDIDINGGNAPCILGNNCRSQLKSLNGKITITGNLNAFITKSVTMEAKEDITVTETGTEADSVIASLEGVSIISHEGSVTVKAPGTNAIYASLASTAFPVTIEAQKNITIESASTGINTHGDISLVSHAGNIDVLGQLPLTCGGSVTVGAYGDITVKGKTLGIGCSGYKISLESSNGSINVATSSNNAPAIATGMDKNFAVKVAAPKGDVTLANTATAEGVPVSTGSLSIAEGTVCVLRGGSAHVQFAEDGSQNRVIIPLTEPLDFTAAESVTSPSYEWNKDTKTLTLNGLNLTAPSSAFSAIAVPDGTTILLHGKNKIAFQAFDSANIGIYAIGTLNVLGNGSLTMDDVQYGIGGSGDATIKDKDITISGGNITINADNYGLRSQGNITITGGNLKITSSTAVFSNSAVTISGGTATIHAKEQGIIAINIDPQNTNSGVTINGGTVNVTTGEKATAGILCMDGKFVISDGTVTIQRECGVTESIPAIIVQTRSKTGTEPLPQNFVMDMDKMKVVEGGTICTLPWTSVHKGYASFQTFSESDNLSLDTTTGKPIGASSNVVIVPNTYQVTFDVNGGSAVAVQTLQKGQKATNPVAPTKSGSNFLGWYQDANFTLGWDFDKDTITNDITLYAKWKHRSSDDSISGGTSGGSSGGASTKPTEQKVTPETKGEATTAKPNATVKGNTATAAIGASDAAKIINNAVKNGSSEILIQPEVKGDAEREVVSLSKASVQDMASKTTSQLSVVTTAAKVNIPKEGVSALSQESGAAISVAVEKKDGKIAVEVKADDKVLDKIKGGIYVTVPVENITEGTVVMLEKADGTTQIIQNAVKENGGFRIPLEGSATIKIVDNSKAFQDVQPTDWYYNAVTFANAHRLLNGTSETTFSPSTKMTRGMIVTSFYNLANEAFVGQAAFKDVPADAYYSNAVAWASKNHIVSGYGDSFAAEDEVTREQLVTFMYNYAKAKGLDVSAKGDMDKFSDHDKVSPWASEAMAYAVGSGILSGKDNQNLDPKGSATRAEVASLLKRFVETASQK